jgi:transcriptional regulator with XRE-family HTH domain
MTRAPAMPEVGPIGRHLIANIDRLRQARGFSWRKLSAELTSIGRPIPPLGLTRMAKAERRVDVDELAALAQVLDVTPGELLTPPGAGKPGKDHAAARAAQDLVTRIGQLVAADDHPADHDTLCGYVDRALRRVQIEVEELLEESAGTRHGRAS